MIMLFEQDGNGFASGGGDILWDVNIR